MKALCWYGASDVRVESVPDPQILNPRDAIVAVSRTAICGSDLHLYHGYVPGMRPGDILGHEFCGEVVEVGRDVKDLRVGDRVVVPFAISCGACRPCTRQLFSLCDNTNPSAAVLEGMYGQSGAGMFGYSHLYGGYAGGQAEYVRVPFADVGPRKLNGLTDDAALFLSDIIPTGWQAAEQCDIRPGAVVAVWGCGPVGLYAIRSAQLMGAERVIAIDRVPERLALARRLGAEVIDYTNAGVLGALRDLTGGRGPDACIDAVGMESHGTTIDAWYDKAKQSMRLETDRPHVLREVMMACGKGGTVSLPGVYGGLIDKIPFGAAFAKGLTIRMGQTHVHRYLPTLFEHVQSGAIDSQFLVSHRLPLADAPHAYEIFAKKQDGCVKVVLQP